MIVLIVVPTTDLIAVVIAVTISAVAMAVVVITVIVAVVMLIAAVPVAMLVRKGHARQSQHGCRHETQPPFHSHEIPPNRKVVDQDYWLSKSGANY